MPSPPALADLAPGLSTAGKLDRSDIEARGIAESHGIAYHHIPVTMASLSGADVEAFAEVLKTAPTPIVAHCRSGTRSALLWALARMRDGADPGSLIAEAARHGIDIAPLPAFAARLR